MDSDNSSDRSYLDQIWINEGADRCRAALTEAFRKNAQHAAGLLNDRKLTFPCLYILRGQIEALRIQRYLNPRNIIALRIANQIRDAKSSDADYLSSKRDSVYPVLKWIVETGCDGEIPEDEYEETLDVAVSVLITIYKDRDILPLVVDLIFKRNRTGRYIHDLVWAVFRVRDSRILKLIAQHMKSSHEKDMVLAAELLNIDQAAVPVHKGNPDGQYAGYLHWLAENEPYLYFTEESFQYASVPVFCAVDLERKYIQNDTRAYNRQPLLPAGEDTSENLAAFKQLSGEEQKILSEYSKKIHDKSISIWKDWLHAPVSEQIKTAKARLEGEE